MTVKCSTRIKNQPQVCLLIFHGHLSVIEINWGGGGGLYSELRLFLYVPSHNSSFYSSKSEVLVLGKNENENL